MVFPLIFGHLTFASHRCWTVYMKKAVFLAAQAWRRQHGDSSLHAAKRDGGGEVLMFVRPGMGPFPLVGWKRTMENGIEVYEGPDGEKCETQGKAFDLEMAKRAATSGGAEGHEALSVLQRFLVDNCSETRVHTISAPCAAPAEDMSPGAGLQSSSVELRGDTQVAGDDTSSKSEVVAQRVVVTTSTLEDWLWRGDHPVVAAMCLAVYAMWIYRVERPPPADHSVRGAIRRYVECDFSPDYKLHGSHAQRLATEMRVPLFEGFTMPPSNRDSETAAMFKQLLTRPLAVPEDLSIPVDIRLLQAFEPTCPPRGANRADASAWDAQAFSAAWVAFSKEQSTEATEGRRRFLSRFEWPSIWETDEVQEHLKEMLGDERDGWEDDGAADPSAAPSIDYDARTPRASVRQYSSLIGERVATNLEGLARARHEKPTKRREEDAHVHESYIKMTIGGGHDAADAGSDTEALPIQSAPSERIFPPVL